MENMAKGRYEKKQTPLHRKLREKFHHLPMYKKAEYLVIAMSIVLAMVIIAAFWWYNNLFKGNELLSGFFQTLQGIKVPFA